MRSVLRSIMVHDFSQPRRSGESPDESQRGCVYCARCRHNRFEIDWAFAISLPSGAEYRNAGLEDTSTSG